METTVPLAPVPDRPPPHRGPVERARDWVEWFGIARLAVAAISLAGLVAAAFWLLRAPEPPVEGGLPMAAGAAVALSPGVATTTTAPPTSPTTAASEIVVHVAGAVVAPGVWHLVPGSRVVDAVTAAGGLARDAVPDSINLAAALSDGDRVYVPRLTDVAASVPAGVTPTTSSSSDAGVRTGPVGLNTASVAELEQLPGVGPATAQAIVSHRDENGPFLTVDDLTEVSGIGPAKLEALRGLVTV